MLALNFPRDSFDQDNTFRFAFKGMRGQMRTATGYLFEDPDTGKIYIMKKSACIKSKYTAADAAETARLSAQTPITNNTVVCVGGVFYVAKILGDYSDAGYLVPVIVG